VSEAPAKSDEAGVERKYTCQQVAAILCLPYETIIALCEADLLGHRLIGPRNERYTLRIITQSQLDEFVERTSVPLHDTGIDSDWGLTSSGQQSDITSAPEKRKMQEVGV
jgi:hypothetical protein